MGIQTNTFFLQYVQFTPPRCGCQGGMADGKEEKMGKWLALQNFFQNIQKFHSKRDGKSEKI